MKRIALAGLVLAVAVGTTAVAYAARSPKALRAAILAAARSEHSVHWSAHELGGGVAATTSVDAGAKSGEQHITFRLGKQTAHVTIIVVSGTSYVRGDAIGLGINLNLTHAQATKYANRWISIPHSDKLYASIAQAVTIGSLIQSITPHGKLSIVTDKHHKRLIGVAGVTGTGSKRKARTLITRKAGQPLPIEADELIPARAFISNVVFSKWNEPVHVQAPASSTPIATVRAS